MSEHKFKKSKKGSRVDNIPETGILTGRYFTDLYGCWWEVTPDTGEKNFWMIGEYPD
ncbi:MAG: hypothetical protein KKC77_19765 [Proteobacteria bacterium]|nr:hypothetical protein [Pseudomonadota bacterium]